jgi:cytochrome c oxidase subunit IV
VSVIAIRYILNSRVVELSLDIFLFSVKMKRHCVVCSLNVWGYFDVISGKTVFVDVVRVPHYYSLDLMSLFVNICIFSKLLKYSVIILPQAARLGCCIFKLSAK